MVNKYGRVPIVNDAPGRCGVTLRGFSDLREREGLSTDSDIKQCVRPVDLSPSCSCEYEAAAYITWASTWASSKLSTPEFGTTGLKTLGESQKSSAAREITRRVPEICIEEV